MKKVILSIAMAFAVTGFTLSPALAIMMQHEEELRAPVAKYSYFYTDSLVGKDIIGSDGVVLGEVENVLISRDGAIHLMLSSGGIFDIGERYAMIPWSAVRNITRHNVMLSVAGDRVTEGPVYRSEALVPGWQTEVNTYYGEEGVREMAPRDGFDTRASAVYGNFYSDTLVGKNILSRDGVVLGEVENVVINRDGTAHIMLSRGGIFDIGERYIMIPWSDVDNITRNNVLLSLSADKVLDAPTFRTEALGPGWEREVNSYYGEESAR